MTPPGTSSPSNAAEVLEQGLAHHRAGHLQQAAAAYQQVLDVVPNHAGALHLLGVVAHQSGDQARAVVLISQAIEADSSVATFYNSLGEAHRVSGDLDRAVAAYGQALALNPKMAEAHANLCIVLRLGGELVEAVSAGRRAVELQPGFAGAHNNLGAALYERGEIDEAAKAYRKAIDADPEFAMAYRNLSGVKTYTPGDPDLAAMARLIENPAMAGETIAGLSYALGKAHDDIDEHDMAFAYYAEGARRRRHHMTYDPEAVARFTDCLIETYSSDLLARLEGSGFTDIHPVFVVGMPRSGTSLVEQILASHPQVHGAGEIKDVSRIIASLPHRFSNATAYPDFVAAIPPEAWSGLGQAYVEELRQRSPDHARIVDKLPNNFQHLGFIHLMLPHARIIHCVRDPVDVCLSCFKTSFHEGNEFTYDLAELGRYYGHYERLMTHWRSVLPGRMLEVRYEDVVSDVEREARRLVDHCDLPWDNHCLAFHETNRQVRTASAAQVRRPIYGTSSGRWRHYRRHLGPLLKALDLDDPN
jgi:tetratricopeptide (TPR) repeat protein